MKQHNIICPPHEYRFDLLFVASYLYFFSFANLTLISECRIMQLQLLPRHEQLTITWWINKIIGNGIMFGKRLCYCNQFSKVPPFLCLICVDSAASYHLSSHTRHQIQSDPWVHPAHLLGLEFLILCTPILSFFFPVGIFPFLLCYPCPKCLILSIAGRNCITMSMLLFEFL